MLIFYHNITMQSLRTSFWQIIDNFNFSIFFHSSYHRCNRFKLTIIYIQGSHIFRLINIQTFPDLFFVFYIKSLVGFLRMLCTFIICPYARNEMHILNLKNNILKFCPFSRMSYLVGTL